MSSLTLEYDVAVLGGGPGGTAAALQAASRGARTCVIEAKHLGGVCLNVGCVPTKAMLAASDLFWRVRRAEQFGIAAAGLKLDCKAFMKRPAEVVEALRAALARKMGSKKHLDVIHGRGRLTDRRTIVVNTAEDEKQVKADSIVIATGSRPVRPEALPWGSPRLMTSDEAVTAPGLPNSVIVVGGGPLGCEFATMYSELGVETFLVEMLDHLLPGFDCEASSAAAALLAERGAEVLTGRRVVEVLATEAAVIAELDDGRKLAADCALVAVGRQANIEGIGLEETGLAVTDGIIPVDDRCRTNVEGIYVAGDAAEKRQFAHLAERMGIVAAENATGHELRDDRSIVPIGVYTHPQIAAVGLSQQAARARFGRVRVLRHSLRDNSAAVAHGQTEGRVKILADPDAGKIHGALWVGPHAIDMIHELALAMRHGITLEQIYHTIHAHPSFQEAVHAAVAPWMNRTSTKRT